MAPLTRADHLEVTLTWVEFRAASYLGFDRWARSRSKGRKHRNGGDPDDFAAGIYGAWGEIVVAKGLGAFWLGDGEEPDRGAPDVAGRYHVRYSPKDQNLLLHDHDHDHEPFLLVVPDDLQVPRFRIVGWTYPAEARQPARWRDDMAHPCYVIPQAALHPIAELDR